MDNTTPIGFPLAIAGLGVVLLVLALAKHTISDLRDELRIEKARRVEAELQLEERNRHLDGALAKIHELKEPTPAEAELENDTPPAA